MHLEAAAEEIICMETEMFGNVGLGACIEPPKRATQTADQVGTTNVLRFGNDQRGITSCGMSVEAAEEDELTLENSISGNARPAACIGLQRGQCRLQIMHDHLMSSTYSASGWWHGGTLGGFAPAKLGLSGAIASTRLAWPSLKGRWTAQRRQRQSPLGGSASGDAQAEWQGHLWGMMRVEARCIEATSAPKLC